MLELRGLEFQWPLLLWALLLLLPFGWVYWRLRLREPQAEQRYPGLRPLTAPARSQRLMAVLVPLLFGLGLTTLLAAMARPQALLALPQRQLDLMLAIDTSSSMRATDIAPNRLAAAQALARQFVDQLPNHVRMGLVSVAATASLAQSPTKDREAMRQAIERLEAQRGTALGSGIVIALSTLRPDADIDVERMTTGRSSRQWYRDPSKPDQKAPEPVEPGSNRNMAVILVSDGKPTLGPDPKQAAKLAGDLGIRVYTVGVGTAQGTTLKVDGMNLRVKLEEAALQEIAKATQAEYFEIGRPADLASIFKTLQARLTLEKPKKTEITGLFVALGTLLVLLGAALSLITRQRIV